MIFFYFFNQTKNIFDDIILHQKLMLTHNIVEPYILWDLCDGNGLDTNQLIIITCSNQFLFFKYGYTRIHIMY